LKVETGLAGVLKGLKQEKARLPQIFSTFSGGMAREKKNWLGDRFTVGTNNS